MKQEEEIGRPNKSSPEELKATSPFMANCTRCGCLISDGKMYCAKCDWDIDKEKREKESGK